MSTNGLDVMIASLRQLSELDVDAVPDVVRILDTEIRKTIAAGTSADGETWKPTKEGNRPLVNAAAHLKVFSKGLQIIARLEPYGGDRVGATGRHDRGWVKGKVQRKILPRRPLPGPIAAAITSVLTEHFERAVKS